MEVNLAGVPGGSFAEVEFNHPQGMALDGETLYICDTENHLIRKADLKARTVETLVGTGQQARSFNVEGVGANVALNSPWDAVIHNGMLYVAMAGPHQLWVVNPKTRAAKPYAGSGRENHVDGPLRDAALAQPLEFTGAARRQVRVFAERVDAVIARHPEAATYAPAPIL